MHEYHVTRWRLFLVAEDVVEKEVSLAVNGEECRIVFIDHQVIHLFVCRFVLRTPNEGPLRIQYKCLVSIYVFS
jgi:hypothetical protein